MQLDRYASAKQSARKVDIFIDEQIERADRDEGGRQPGEILGPGRRGIG